MEPVEHLALVKGDLSAPGPVLVRVHAVNVLGDLLGVGEPAGASLRSPSAMHAIEREGRGVIVLIRDLGPKSVSGLGQSRAPHRPSQARQRAAAARSRSVSARRSCATSASHDMTLLTNTPTDVYVGLEAYGLRIVGTRAIE